MKGLIVPDTMLSAIPVLYMDIPQPVMWGLSLSHLTDEEGKGADRGVQFGSKKSRTLGALVWALPPW